MHKSLGYKLNPVIETVNVNGEFKIDNRSIRQSRRYTQQKLWHKYDRRLQIRRIALYTEINVKV